MGNRKGRPNQRGRNGTCGIALLLAFALALLPGIARAGCFDVSVKGMEVCNCTSNPVEMDVCQTETVSTGTWGSFSVSGGGASIGVSGGTSTSTGLSGCTKALVPSHACVYYLYDLSCCLTEKTTGFWIMKKTSTLLQCVVVGYTIHETPARC